MILLWKYLVPVYALEDTHKVGWYRSTPLRANVRVSVFSCLWGSVWSARVNLNWNANERCTVWIEVYHRALDVCRRAWDTTDIRYSCNTSSCLQVVDALEFTRRVEIITIEVKLKSASIETSNSVKEKLQARLRRKQLWKFESRVRKQNCR